MKGKEDKPGMGGRGKGRGTSYKPALDLEPTLCIHTGMILELYPYNVTVHVCHIGEVILHVHVYHMGCTSCSTQLTYVHILIFSRTQFGCWQWRRVPQLLAFWRRKRWSS